MLILTLPLHEKGLHQESFFRYQTYTLIQKAALRSPFFVAKPICSYKQSCPRAAFCFVIHVLNQKVQVR